jgi:hypothetical protein
MVSIIISALKWTLCECVYTRAQFRRNKHGAYSERTTPPLAEKETLFATI